ncbi:hypothetical protein [Bordetella bronchialis]|uniref:Uncharacterized protein n=1 Tax=Bordetella bronchialis TaxID=463025 RepID=A0ABM6CMR8_9BORD|nr:hypothetical protein [Bordetella bronchialis]ANN65244.1 hypothetical protein BAU06_02005 [Bordetella bronchialis]
MATRFFSAFFATLAGPLFWSAHFLLAYGYNGVVCARPALQAEWLGVPASSWVVCASGCLALAGMALVYRRIRKRLPSLGDPRFLPGLAAALTLLSALAVIWQTLPALMLAPCGQGAP